MDKCVWITGGPKDKYWATECGTIISKLYDGKLCPRCRREIDVALPDNGFEKRYRKYRRDTALFS